ncbi:hypothetical protein ColKHC_10457 [Colletotrichum higginsianum]|nr:hypothetical protein ColKHC_10457 [Colletotrichum higginsianum]
MDADAAVVQRRPHKSFSKLRVLRKGQEARWARARDELAAAKKAAKKAAAAPRQRKRKLAAVVEEEEEEEEEDEEEEAIVSRKCRGRRRLVVEEDEDEDEEKPKPEPALPELVEEETDDETDDEPATPVRGVRAAAPGREAKPLAIYDPAAGSIRIFLPPDAAPAPSL